VPEVRVRARAAQLHHTGAVAQRVRDAVAGRAVDPSAEPAGAPAGPRVDVLVEGETASVRVDATGEPADRRGWRLATARAPLPPTVAAAALLATGWDGTAPLLDPLCGSGTVGVEAALLAAARPPAVGRRFAVECWPSFAPGTWASAAAPPRPAAAPPAPVLLSDRDAGAVEAAEGNAARAGVADRVTVARAALASAADRAAGLPPGWLVTNPPWGDRLGGGDPRDLHAALGALVRGLDGWRVAVVAADPATARHVGLPLTTAWRTTVGGTRVALLVDAR
jgi:putative N6-adenine-specific DNA methylase